MRLYYADEKNEIARKLGYKDYHDCVVSEYEKMVSGSKIAAVFDVTSDAIFYTLKIMGVKKRKRGGANNTTSVIGMYKIAVACKCCKIVAVRNKYHIAIVIKKRGAWICKKCLHSKSKKK